MPTSNRSITSLYVKRIKLRILKLLILLLLPSISYAGGEAWAFKVQKILNEGNGYVGYLVPLQSSDKFPGSCKKLIVHIRYSPQWWNPEWWRIVSMKKHNEAISILKTSEASGATVTFGAMGEGFLYSKTDNCQIESRALSVFTIQNGSKGIFSFYKWP